MWCPWQPQGAKYVKRALCAWKETYKRDLQKRPIHTETWLPREAFGPRISEVVVCLWSLYYCLQTEGKARHPAPPAQPSHQRLPSDDCRYTCVYTYVYIYICIYLYVYICMCIYIHMHIYMYTYVYVYRPKCDDARSAIRGKEEVLILFGSRVLINNFRYSLLSQNNLVSIARTSKPQPL